VSKEKKGSRAIRKSELVTVKNTYEDRDYEVEITLPEFTCLCPMTGYPDFAIIQVVYVPDKLLLELKSVKLYINGFRNKGIFHEEAVNQILDDLTTACRPRRMDITGDFNPRGNVKTVVRAQYRKES